MVGLLKSDMKFKKGDILKFTFGESKLKVLNIIKPNRYQLLWLSDNEICRYDREVVEDTLVLHKEAIWNLKKETF